MNNLPTIWSSTEEIMIPQDASEITDIVPHAGGLNPKQREKLIAAFRDLEAYDMAVEYAWRKAISRLKEGLASLGMQFIGEMLGRNDITDSTPYETVVTEIQAIQLSEQLGLITPTAGLHLRHAQEIITHFASGSVPDELDKISALNIIKNTIKYVLGNENMRVALEFTQFRDKLLKENLKQGDEQLDMLIQSPLFYSKTVCFILLNSIRIDQGARIEHALANFNLILPLIWEKLSENDKWNVGFAYRDVVSDNNTYAANGLKQALLKVAGFDFVPESLRSNTFIKAAQNVINVHYSFNNFHNEPAAVKALANLGTIIPRPAFLPCIQAYLLVCIGSRYGVSDLAVPKAKEQLENIPEERWRYYFEKGINNDREVLSNLRSSAQITRFCNLIHALGWVNFSDLPRENQRFYDSLTKRNVSKIESIAKELYTKANSI